MNTTVRRTFSIGAAAVSECGECAELLAEQLGEHGVEVSADRLSCMLEKVVADKRQGFLLSAREDGRIVGVAYVATIPSVEHCGFVAWLEELYVTPNHRLRGIGTALVEAVLDRACRAGIVAVDLEIDAGHSHAKSLYRRLGFRPLSRSRWVRELAPHAA
jgi:GNAT superfamily N-acetyltransferase